MRARIIIGEHVIKADCGGGWVVGQPRQRVEKGREKPIEVIDGPSYYATFDQALSGALQRTIHESDATSLEEVREIIQDFRRQCVALMDLTSRTDQRKDRRENWG